MAQVYSEQLASGHALVSGTLAVPAGFVWVIRLITVFYPSAIGGLFKLTGNSSLTTYWWDSAPPSVVGEFRFWNQLNLVLTDVEDYQVTGSGAPDFSLNGYALTLP